MASAIVGNEGSVSSVGPDSICRLVMTDSTGIGICTGSLIHPNQILTAAHCVDVLKKDSVIKVSCGYRGFEKEKLVSQKTKSDNTVFLAGVNFHEEAIGISYLIHPNWSKDQNNFDIAIINLNHKLTIKPMVIKDPRLINHPIRCSSAGFGINKNINMGFLQVGSVDAKQLQNNSFSFIDSTFTAVLTNPNDEDSLYEGAQGILKYADRNTILSAAVVYGDSGGPVFCKNQDSDEVFQVAINRAVYFTLKQRGKSPSFDIVYKSAFSRVDIDFGCPLSPLATSHCHRSKSVHQENQQSKQD